MLMVSSFGLCLDISCRVMSCLSARNWSLFDIGARLEVFVEWTATPSVLVDRGRNDA